MSEKKTENKFLKFVAYLQILGIILVVFGHSCHLYPDGSHGHGLLVYRMMYSFRMPLFMFTSGFLLLLTTDARPSGWLRFSAGKVQRLLLPFVCLCAVVFVPRVWLNGLSDEPVEGGLAGFAKSMLFTDSLAIPYYWFIHSSFTLLVLVYGVICVCRRRNIPAPLYFGALLSFFIVAPLVPLVRTSFFSLSMTISLGVFFVLGCIYGRYHKAVDRTIRWDSWLIFSVLLVCWATAFFIEEDNYFLSLICSMFGIMMMISLAKIIESRNWRFLDHLVGANYIIFLLSWFFNVLAQQILHHYVELPWYVHTLLSLTLGIYVPWLFYRIMCRYPNNKFSRLCAYILGQRLRTIK